jgi:hypothetical protein
MLEESGIRKSNIQANINLIYTNASNPTYCEFV